MADSAPTIPVVASKAPSLADRYNAAVAPLTEIQKPDSAHPWDYHEAIKAVGNIGAGGMGLALHPIDTLAGLGGMLTAPLELAQGHPWSSTVPAQFLKSLQTNPYGAIESGIGQAAVGDLVARTPELARSGAESVARAATDTGAGPVKRLVKDTQKANETIDAVNQDRVEKQRTIRSRPMPITVAIFSNFARSTNNLFAMQQRKLVLERLRIAPKFNRRIKPRNRSTSRMYVTRSRRIRLNAPRLFVLMPKPSVHIIRRLVRQHSRIAQLPLPNAPRSIKKVSCRLADRS